MSWCHFNCNWIKKWMWNRNTAVNFDVISVVLLFIWCCSSCVWLAQRHTFHVRSESDHTKCLYYFKLLVVVSSMITNSVIFVEKVTLISCSRNSLLLWNPKIHYFVHWDPLLGPIQNDLKPVRTFTPYFPEISFNIIIQFLSRSLNQFLRGFLTKMSHNP